MSAAIRKGDVRPVWRNARVVFPVAAAQCLVYFVLNHYTVIPARPLPLTAVDRWVPFLPWTLWPYLALLVAPVALALPIRDRDIFRRGLRAYLIAMGLTFLIFLVCPTYYVRHELPLDNVVHAAVHHWLITVDSPLCCFPSGHVVAPAVLCWSYWRDGRPLGGWALALFPVLALSILTTKQHYVWDLLGAFLVAGFGLGVARGWPLHTAHGS